VLRRTGARIEEMLELTHLSLRQYRAPTGDTVPLVQISPSKTDHERVMRWRSPLPSADSHAK
jgi:hypothetical protein